MILNSGLREMRSALSDADRVKSYFQAASDRFDKIYSSDKGLFARFIDRTFRRSMALRFEQVLKECRDIKGKTALDAGCGSGRYSVALARLGARLVTGIDFADNMLDKAKALAKENGVSATCQFICGDFLIYDFKEKYDVCIAIGLFDYIKTPDDFLKKMAGLAREKLIISFPARWRIESISRKIRLLAAGCLVRFYTISRIEGLLRQLNNIKDYKILDLGRDYLVIIGLNY